MPPLIHVSKKKLRRYIYKLSGCQLHKHSERGMDLEFLHAIVSRAHEYGYREGMDDALKDRGK